MMSWNILVMIVLDFVEDWINRVFLLHIDWHNYTVLTICHSVLFDLIHDDLLSYCYLISYDLIWFISGPFTILTSYRIKRFCSWVYSCNFIVIFLIRQFSNLILVSIAGHYEFSIDTMDSWGKIYSFYLHFSFRDFWD